MSNENQTRTPATEKQYFDLHTSGIGYLSRIRVVTPKGQGRKSDPMLCCAINALRGSIDDPQYTYFDLRVTDVEAQRLVNEAKEAVAANEKVIVAFTIGDIYTHSYTKRVDGADEVRAINKGRLIGISYMKIDGEIVYRRERTNGETSETPQSSDAAQGTGTEG